jgi:hypothetical protein
MNVEGREGNPERKRRAPCSVLNHKLSDPIRKMKVKMKRGILVAFANKSLTLLAMKGD